MQSAGSPAAMVWGAAGGIGRALAAEIKEAGGTVAAVVRQLPVRAGIGAPAGEVAAGEVAADVLLEADVADDFAVQRAVFAAAQQMPAVDLWIYAVGDIAATPVGTMDNQTWGRILNANLSGAYRTIHHSLPLLAEDAHIVFIGAYSERLALPGLAAYAAAKAGLEAFAAALAKEQRGRRVTLVRPGAVATPLWEKTALRLPRNASTAGEVAGKILEAVRAGHSGTLDL